MRRITKAALGGLAGCALVLGGTQLASGETLFEQAFPGWLRDLDADNVAPLPPASDGQPMTGAFDSAKAKLKVTQTSDKTTFSLEVRDIDVRDIDGIVGTSDDIVDREFGSHLHIGPCVTGIPGAAGDHYTNPDLSTDLPLEDREVWFKVIPNKYGVAFNQTEVPYVPKDPDGAMSIVIHRDHTNTNPDLGKVGAAGPREVCLPLNVSDIFPSTVPN